MRYRISKIARIVGITTEAIRFYEKKGILTSAKDEENGYRTYDVLDIGTLLRCRTYSQFGLSLSEAARLINDCTLNEANKTLVKQEAYLEHEIERHQRMLRRLRELNRLIAGAEEDTEKCSIVLHPGIFRMDYHRNGLLTEDQALLKIFSEWSNMLPFSFVSLRIPLQSLRGQIQDYFVGLGILEEDAAFLGVEENQYIHHFSPGLSVCTTLKVVGRGPVDIRSLQYLYDYALRHELRPAGDAFSQMILTIHRSSPDHTRYYRVWLPVH